MSIFPRGFMGDITEAAWCQRLWEVHSGTFATCCYTECWHHTQRHWEDWWLSDDMLSTGGCLGVVAKVPEHSPEWRCHRCSTPHTKV